MNKIAIVVIIILAALSRLIPHPPNFTPIMAIGFLSGLFLKNYRFGSYLIPIIAMLLSDIVLEYFYGIGIHPIMPFVYSGIILSTFIGKKLDANSKVHKVFLYILSSSLIFFIVSNFGVWIFGYPKTFSGFISCYTMAIPFYKNTLAGDLFYTGTIFGMYLFYKKSVNLIKPNFVK